MTEYENAIEIGMWVVVAVTWFGNLASVWMWRKRRSAAADEAAKYWFWAAVIFTILAIIVRSGNGAG